MRFFYRFGRCFQPPLAMMRKKMHRATGISQKHTHKLFIFSSLAWSWNLFELPHGYFSFLRMIHKILRFHLIWVFLFLDWIVHSVIRTRHPIDCKHMFSTSWVRSFALSRAIFSLYIPFGRTLQCIRLELVRSGHGVLVCDTRTKYVSKWTDLSILEISNRRFSNDKEHFGLLHRHDVTTQNQFCNFIRFFLFWW